MRTVRCSVIGELVLTLAGVGLLTSCVSVRARSGAPWDDRPEGTIAVDVYETTGARSAGVHTQRAIVSELLRKEGRRYVPVRESAEASWIATGLEPGRYRVRVGRWADAEGTVHGLGSSDRVAFEIRDGQRVQVDVVLKHPRRVVAAIVVPVVIVGGLAWIASNAMSGMTIGLALH